MSLLGKVITVIDKDCELFNMVGTVLAESIEDDILLIEPKNGPVDHSKSCRCKECKAFSKNPLKNIFWNYKAKNNPCLPFKHSQVAEVQ